MNGFLLIDKPEGITSFYCVKILRRISGLRRIGFAGTLDPLATGLMIFALGEATKLISYLEKSDKVYEVSIRLGAVSDTYDAQGKISPVVPGMPGKPGVPSAERPQRGEIEKIIEDEFIGLREQMPPAYSALKIAGRRAYDLARKGEKVVLKKRPVNFYDIKTGSYEWPVLKLKVHCGSGTYIRSLAHDLGQMLGCGGYVEQLRRVKIGLYNVKDAVSPDGLDVPGLQKRLVPPQVFFHDWPQKELTDREYAVVANGGFIDDTSGREDNGAGEDDIVRGPIMALYRGECVGVLETHKGKLKFAKKFNIV